MSGSPIDDILQNVSRFRADVFPAQRGLFERLVHDGQQPKALVISCADSRVVPELITGSGPGELFVCRNAGNIVPPFADLIGGVSSSIEFAVVALGVRDIVICGHSDCGAMKGLAQPEQLAEMPNVAVWLRHSRAAHEAACRCHPQGLRSEEALRTLAQQNVVAQLDNLRTHPSVAARLATGDLTLHGWFFELTTGTMLVLDPDTGLFALPSA